MAIGVIGFSGFGYDLGWRFVIVALKQSLISRVCGRVRPGVQVTIRKSVAGFGFQVPEGQI